MGSKVIGQNRIIIVYNIIIVIEIIASINTVIQIPACNNTVKDELHIYVKIIRDMQLFRFKGGPWS